MTRVRHAPTFIGVSEPHAGTTLGDYELVDVLGRGGMGTTWRARSISSGAEVALKLLDIGRVDDWKAVELFEREVAVLRSIQHPSVPAYVEAFEREDGAGLVLVQELAPGETLERLVEREGPLDASRLEQLAEGLLGLLDYLHGLHPPVIHRDIKPANILVDASGAARLVDFGAVRACLGDDGRGAGSTVVGTFGYMAPEQFRGVASPQTDLYGLGATLLFAASGRHPDAFPHVRMEIAFEDEVELSERMAAWLRGLLRAASEDRFISASAAHAALSGQAAVRPSPGAADSASVETAAALPDVPARIGAVKLKRDGGYLIVHQSRWASVRQAPYGGMLIVLGFVACSAFFEAAGMSLLFAALLLWMCYTSLVRVTLTISERGMQLDTEFLFRRVRKRWRHDEFEGCSYRNMTLHGSTTKTINIGLELNANGECLVFSALRSSVSLEKLKDVIEREHARYVGRGASAEASAEVEEPAFDRALERVPCRG